MDVMAILHTANVKTRKLWHLVAPWVVKTRKLWHLVAPWVVPLVAYRKAILVAALPLLAFYLDCYENWPRWYWNNYQHCTARGRVPILIGTHHKSGTVLMRHIMSDTCRALKWNCVFNDKPRRCRSPREAARNNIDVCFLEHGGRFRKLGDGLPYRFIHVMRDPLEMVISAYQYHLNTTESWAHRRQSRWNGTTYVQYLRSLPLRQGLIAEVQRSFRDSLKSMPSLYNRTAAHPCTLNLHLEDFARDYSRTTRRMWDLLGITDRRTLNMLNERAAQHNIYSRSRHIASRHSTSKTQKQEMRAHLRAAHKAYVRIQEVRTQAGFPSVGREGVLKRGSLARYRKAPPPTPPAEAAATAHPPAPASTASNASARRMSADATPTFK